MNDKKYAFWIELEDGQEVRWAPLTQHQAVTMYNRTSDCTPANVKSLGWEEVR